MIEGSIENFHCFPVKTKLKIWSDSQARFQLYILRGGHESKKRKEKQGQNFQQVSFFKEIQRIQIIRNKTTIMY